MRALIGFLLLFIAPPLTVAHSLDILEAELNTFSADSLLRTTLQPAIDRLPELRELLHQADSLVRLNDLQLDFIGQWHEAEGDTPFDQKQTRISQKRVRRLLDSLNYELVGHEGWPRLPITCDTLRRLFESQDKFSIWPTDPWVTEDKLRRFLWKDGIFSWMCRKKEHAVVGIDDTVLVNLHGQFYYPQPGVYSALRSRGDNAYYRFLIAVRAARTEVALVGMVIELHRRGAKRGAVVMGFAHQPDWDTALARYSLRSSFYPSLDLSKGQIEESNRLRQIQKGFSRNQ